MAAPGRGRGEGKNVHLIDEIDERAEQDRQEQIEAARILGMAESDIPIRGRGGFRPTELRTIPPNITQLRADQASQRQIDVLANYVQIIPMTQRAIHKYRIDYEPAVESASLMRFLFREATATLFQKRPIFDGAHECRSGQKLQNDLTEAVVVDAQAADSRRYIVKIAHVGISSFGPENLRVYNMHMKEFLRKMGYYSPQVGLFVHQNHGVPVGQEIMMLRGFRTAANEQDGNKMMMNLEGAHKLVQKKNLLQYMREIREQAGTNWRTAMSAELIGHVVVTSYDQRVYRIEEIVFNMNPQSTFDRKGTQVSFIEYYQTAHRKSIQDDKQPLLKAVPNNQRKRDDEPQRDILLVPEFCNIAGLTGPQRNDNRLKMDLIRASQVSPSDRVKHIREFLAALHKNNEIREQLTAWAYSYDTEAVRLKAHVVVPTGYACNERTLALPMQSWPKCDLNSADIRVNELAVSPLIKKMAVITSRTNLNFKGQILGVLKQGFDKVGLKIGGPPYTMDIQDGDSARDFITAVRNVPQDCDMALVIMSNQNKERYDAIKKAASVERGLITQVVTAKLMTDEKKNRSAAAKIGIQIAAKLGGEPWICDIPMRKTMVCGYDTYHDTAQRGRSFGAFCASLNPHFARWYSKADAHDRIDEISAQVSTNLTEAISHYKKFNKGEVPERIIIYRDGVGEGQLAHVLTVEVKKIKEALDKISEAIKLTFIVVSKRIGARFYMRANDGSFSNPPPGTIVDHTVTRQERYDFYLISQSTRQGTVTPTYYNIIFDDCGFGPEIHQKLAFKLCLLYYNWSGTVRVPAPCQYAHKLALLCGEHLHAQPNTVMDDKLHFL